MSGYDDERISGTKISPLDSAMKQHTPHADTHGVIGDDEVLQSSHIPPFAEHEHNIKPGVHIREGPGHHQSKHERNAKHEGSKMQQGTGQQQKQGMMKEQKEGGMEGMKQGGMEGMKQGGMEGMKQGNREMNK